jgi:hypothetical protein
MWQRFVKSKTSIWIFEHAEEIMTNEGPEFIKSKKTLAEDEETASDKDQKYKFLKPVKGAGPKEGATVAVFERGTAAKEIVAFWRAELAKAAEKEVAAKKKEVDDLK